MPLLFYSKLLRKSVKRCWFCGESCLISVFSPTSLNLWHKHIFLPFHSITAELYNWGRREIIRRLCFPVNTDWWWLLAWCRQMWRPVLTSESSPPVLHYSVTTSPHCSISSLQFTLHQLSSSHRRLGLNIIWTKQCRNCSVRHGFIVIKLVPREKSIWNYEPVYGRLYCPTDKCRVDVHRYRQYASDTG